MPELEKKKLSLNTSSCNYCFLAKITKVASNIPILKIPQTILWIHAQS